MTKKLYIQTWGCQMNVYDSVKMADVMAPLGFEKVEDPAEADLAILNTCHIREKAAEKVYSELGRLRDLKSAKRAKGGEMILAVAGCVAQAEGPEIIARQPAVDMVIGPQSYQHLPKLLERVAARERVVAVDFPAEDKFDALPEESIAQGPSAFLAVQEGCDKFCTFCVVPYTRGAEYSRPAMKVLDEARRMVAQGAIEITLLGQNVNAWHGEGPQGGEWGLGRLIEAMAGIEGLQRIRYTTSHPRDMADDLIAAHRDIPQLMPYLHLPVQSGSDRILAAMNRRHTGAEYRAIIERLRAARPDIAFSSDFIVGFPGETDQDFEDSLSLIRDVGFPTAYSFKYSPRPGTPAAKQSDQVPDAVMDERLQRLQALLAEQARAFNASFIGRTIPVLFDRIGRRPGQLQGRTPHNQPIHAEAPPRLVGRILPVIVTAATATSLTGRVETVGQEEAA